MAFFNLAANHLALTRTATSDAAESRQFANVMGSKAGGVVRMVAKVVVTSAVPSACDIALLQPALGGRGSAFGCSSVVHESESSGP